MQNEWQNSGLMWEETKTLAKDKRRYREVLLSPYASEGAKKDRIE